MRVPKLEKNIYKDLKSVVRFSVDMISVTVGIITIDEWITKNQPKRKVLDYMEKFRKNEK